MVKISTSGSGEGCAVRRTTSCGLRWPPRQSLARSREPSLAWYADRSVAKGREQLPRSVDREVTGRNASERNLAPKSIVL